MIEALLAVLVLLVPLLLAWWLAGRRPHNAPGTAHDAARPTRAQHPMNRHARRRPTP